MDDTLFALAPLAVESRKQSKIGIASCIVCVLGVIIFCGIILFLVMYISSNAQSDPNAMLDQAMPMMTTLGLFAWLGPILSLIGIGLGIITLIQKKDKKIFGIIGLIVSGLFLLVICLLAIYGLSMGQLTGL